MVLPDGRAPDLGDQLLPHEQLALLQRLARVAVLCDEADLDRRDGAWENRGEPTDVALLHFAHRLGWSRERALLAEPQTNAIAFEPEHRFAASFHARIDGGRSALVKGASERVLPMCGLEPADAAALAGAGLRVLALEEGIRMDPLPEQATPPESSGLTFLGFVGPMDPLLPGVQQAIQRCHQASIRVWMVTGDHLSTAAAIGRELEQASARQKLQLVQAAQRAGHFVAVGAGPEPHAAGGR